MVQIDCNKYKNESFVALILGILDATHPWLTITAVSTHPD